MIALDRIARFRRELLTEYFGKLTPEQKTEYIKLYGEIDKLQPYQHDHAIMVLERFGERNIIKSINTHPPEVPSA